MRIAVFNSTRNMSAAFDGVEERSSVDRQLPLIDIGVSDNLSRFDSAVIKVALAWLPFGGVDADITYDEFGLSPIQHSQFVLNILTRCSLPELTVQTKLDLRQIAQSTITAAST